MKPASALGSLGQSCAELRRPGQKNKSITRKKRGKKLCNFHLATREPKAGKKWQIMTVRSARKKMMNLPQGGGRPGENKKTPHEAQDKKTQLATGEQKTRSAGKRLQFVACHRGAEGQEGRKMHYLARSAGKKNKLATGDQETRRPGKNT